MDTKVSLSCWQLSRNRELPCRARAPSFPSDLLRDGAEAAGEGLNAYSWEGMENDPDQTGNSKFLFCAFNLH